MTESPSQRILKYTLEITDYQDVTIPHGIILSVAEQAGALCMWALVEPEGRERTHCIRIFGTGGPVHRSEAELGRFIGTVPMSNGLVWHVFELSTRSLA